MRLNHYQQISQDPLKLFEAIVEALIQSTADDPSRPWLAESRVFRIVVAEMRNPFLLPDSLLDSEYLTFIKELEEILRRGHQEGLFTTRLDAGLLAQLLVNTLHGLLMLNGLPFQPDSVGMKQVKQVAPFWWAERISRYHFPKGSWDGNDFISVSLPVCPPDRERLLGVRGEV